MCLFLKNDTNLKCVDYMQRRSALKPQLGTWGENAVLLRKKVGGKLSNFLYHLVEKLKSCLAFNENLSLGILNSFAQYAISKLSGHKNSESIRCSQPTFWICLVGATSLCKIMEPIRAFWVKALHLRQSSCAFCGRIHGGNELNYESWAIIQYSEKCEGCRFLFN